MVNVLLDASKNEKELFMKVYDKYFPGSDSDRGEPHPDVMGWSSYHICNLKNINMYHMYSWVFWITENENNSIVRSSNF